VHAHTGSESNIVAAQYVGVSDECASSAKHDECDVQKSANIPSMEGPSERNVIDSIEQMSQPATQFKFKHTSHAKGGNLSISEGGKESTHPGSSRIIERGRGKANVKPVSAKQISSYRNIQNSKQKLENNSHTPVK
jgi:hypothetical protein